MIALTVYVIDVFAVLALRGRDFPCPGGSTAITVKRSKSSSSSLSISSSKSVRAVPIND